jgi:hypothetical protein
MAAGSPELEQLIADLSEEQMREVVNFAKFLRWSDERREWREFGQQQFAKAYGDDEPEYTLNDLRPEPGA